MLKLLHALFSQFGIGAVDHDVLVAPPQDFQRRQPEIRQIHHSVVLLVVDARGMNDTPDIRVENGAGTHAARAAGHVDRALPQEFGIVFLGGLAAQVHFAVRKRVVLREAGVQPFKKQLARRPRQHAAVRLVTVGQRLEPGLNALPEQFDVLLGGYPCETPVGHFVAVHSQSFLFHDESFSKRGIPPFTRNPDSGAGRRQTFHSPPR